MKHHGGKPVENAAVVFHPIDDKGKDQGGMELKTDEEGNANLNVIPIGDTLRLQVIATGYQTFGNDYEIKTAKREITIKLRHPARGVFDLSEAHGRADWRARGQRAKGQEATA